MVEDYDWKNDATDKEIDEQLKQAEREALRNADLDYWERPRTFAEWVEMYGEPEYEDDVPTEPSELSIEVVDCTPKEKTEEKDYGGDVIYMGKNEQLQINYPRFVEVFAAENNLVCCHGLFYSPEGAVSTESIRGDIYESIISVNWTARVDTPTNAILTSLKDKCVVDALLVNEKVIPLSNGDLHIDNNVWEFRKGEKKHAPYRLSVAFTKDSGETPLFNKWLQDVFEPEDILTIQDIMGYCLVPIVAAQEAFFIIGEAGSGKSGLGTILKGLLGNGYETAELQKLVIERFQLAKIENKLLVYDDDLGSSQLLETGVFKKVVTADTPLTLERKNEPLYQYQSYCRILASGNAMLSAVHDDKNGFRRRLHPILAKPKSFDRKISQFYEKILTEEKEQILRWALVGLKRVINNGWKITWSEKSLKYMEQLGSDKNHFQDFFGEVFEIDATSDVTSAEIKKLYGRWCKDNAISGSEYELVRWFRDNADKLEIPHDQNIKRQGKKVRGYRSLKTRTEWRTDKISL